MKTFKQYLDKKTLTPAEIAKKHNVSIDTVQAALTKGIKVEREHTDHPDVAKKITLAHLGEDPNYYEKLKKVEKKK